MLVVGDGVLALAVAPRCRAGAFSCRSAAAPNAGVAARCSRTSQGWRQSRNAAVLQRPATPQRHSAPQREAFFSRPPFFVHCIASVLRGARMEQALELRALAPNVLPHGSRSAHGAERPSSHATAPCTATLCIAAPPMLASNAPAHAPRARRSFPRPARRGTTVPCAVRGAFAATEKVSCGLWVSMRWNEPPVSV